MQKLLKITDSTELSYLFGVNDRNIRFLETELGISVNVESQGILLRGDKGKIVQAERFIQNIIELKEDGFSLTREELTNKLNLLPSKIKKVSNPERFKDKQQASIDVAPSQEKTILPKTKGQIEYINAIKNYGIVFGIGPEGTGKTYLAISSAVNFLQNKLVRKIVLVRPELETDGSLSLFQGDIKNRINPYFRYMYDILCDIIDIDIIEKYLRNGVIEMVPLSYIRGRTFNNAFVVLDGSHNCTTEELRIFLFI